MFIDYSDPDADRAERMEEREWHDFNANRVMRDLQYDEWCTAHGFDPEDAHTAWLYELDTVETCPSTEAQAFWREKGFNA
jgi:hypothetical protein